MEGKSISQPIRFPLSHFPTFFLIVGYPVYWLELYVFRLSHGHTTPLAWTTVSLFALVVLWQSYPRILAGRHSFAAWFSQESWFVRLLLVAMGVGAGAILLCALYASLLPPHLIQEFDALNYHITLPRQHLLRGSFDHISWSTADLFVLPIDFALAPFWLSTFLPNKLPQFFFFIGLLGACGQLARYFSDGKTWPSVLIVLAILGSHSMGIQMGTAMLDIVICYLFFAAFDSFRRGATLLGAIELSFYFWSKPLIPVQFLVTVMIFGLIRLVLRALGIRQDIWASSCEKIQKPLGDVGRVALRGLGLFLLLSLFIAGPFISKSLRYSATPLFPLGTGMFRAWSIPQSPEKWESIKRKEAQWLASRDQYGSGRGIVDFVKHFWLAAVPEKGVNNRYDYPLGLMYLLFVGPFLFFFFSSLRRKAMPWLSLWVVVSWVIWWVGSQQTRFLFIPLILMYLAVLSTIRLPSRMLLKTMLVAIVLVSVSAYRANRQDFGKWGASVLRPEDQELIQRAKDPELVTAVTLPFFDVAYAAFPVEVSGNDSMFIFKQNF